MALPPPTYGDSLHQEKIPIKEPQDLVSSKPSGSPKNVVDSQKDYAVVDIKAGESEDAQLIADLYSPFPVNPQLEANEDEDNILRIHAIVVGAILGGVVNAANVYLGE